MDNNVQSSRVSAVRWCLMLHALLLVLHYASATEDMSLRVANGDSELIPYDINPVSFFENTTAEFTCFCLDTNLQNLEGRMALRRNGFIISDSICSQITMIHRVTISIEDEGEYDCMGYLPNNSSVQPLFSEIRDIVVFNPDDIIAPPIQYAVMDSPYILVCSLDYEYALISWIMPGSTVAVNGPHVIESVGLNDEGVYTCEVYLADADVYYRKPVELYVVVPPNITHPLPDDPVHRTNNDPLSFIIEFNSKPLATTTVTWFHNNHPIQNGIETIFTSDYEGYSILTLSTVSRSNKGVYRVEVANNFSSIPEAQRTVSSSVELSLSVAPILPSNIEINTFTTSRVQVTWDLIYTHPDQLPTTIIVLLTDSITEVEEELTGPLTNVLLDVIPGVRYEIVIITINHDDERSTLPIPFRADTAAPQVRSVEMRRQNMTSFNITTSLDYIGADTITHFIVRYRHRNTTEWSQDIIVDAYPTRGMEHGLEWYGIVTHGGLGEPIELSISVVNDAGHSSSDHGNDPHILEETLTPLSAPSTPTLLSASHDSLTLSFNLPTQGTPPVLHIIINITSPSHMQWECQGVQSRMLGEELDCTVPRLSSATQYTLAVYGLGYAGRGNASHEVTFTTSSIDNSLPVWVIIVVCVVVAMTLLIIILAIILVIIHCCKLHQAKRHYKFNAKRVPVHTAPKPLDPSHSILNRHPPQKLNTSRVSPPPISPTSSTLTPQPCRSTPSTTATFKFETTSDSSCSNSEISEVQTPTYSYRVTPPPPPTTVTTTTSHPSFSSTMPSSQQSYNSLRRGTDNRMFHTQQSLSSTRDSLASCPPAPLHCATNV